MSLLGATIGVDSAYLTIIVGDAATLARYSRGDSTHVTAKCDAAADRFRSAAIKGGYSPTSVDALTTSTIPESVRDHIARIALDLISAGGMGRPAEIEKKGIEAQQFLSRLAGGAETIDSLSASTPTGGSGARVGAPPNGNIFDLDNMNSPYGSRFRPI